MFFYGFVHCNPFKRAFEINFYLAQLNFGCPVQCNCYTFNHFFSKIHHPQVVFVGYIYFHNRELRIVSTIHSFVTEIFGKLVNTIEPANNQAFQVKFVGNTQIERYI